MQSSVKMRVKKVIKTSRSSKATCSKCVLVMLHPCVRWFVFESVCRHHSVIPVSELDLCTRLAMGERVLWPHLRRNSGFSRPSKAACEASAVFVKQGRSAAKCRTAFRSECLL